MNTTFKYDHYFQYDELSDCLKTLQEKYSDYMELSSICETPEQKQVWQVTLTNFKTGPALSKPAIYIDGNTHAGEVTGSMAAMHTIDYLLSNLDDQKVKCLLDEKVVYVIPRISPDGAETYLSTPYTLRSVNRPYLADKKGIMPFDIDDNGVILMMRVKDQHGAYKKGTKHSLLMEKRSPDETSGEFYNIYTEGMIENFDGENIPGNKTPWGLDFNRNYPYGWFSESRQPGAGPYPLSNPETKAVVDFVLSHQNIGVVATHHTSGGVLLFPPGTMPSSQASNQDIDAYKTIGKMATQEMGYDVINIFDHFMKDKELYSSGAFDDWCYQTQGILAYTVELWDMMTRAGKPIDWKSDKIESFEEECESFLAQIEWVNKEIPEALVDWQEVQHPQLGLVEVGGIHCKFTHQNCPPKYLLQEVEKTTKFIMRYAATLPQLKIDEIQVTPLEADLYKVEAVIANHGYLPTNISQEAIKLDLKQPIKVSLEGDFQLISGEKIIEVDQLAGFGQINTGFHFYNGITTEKSEAITKKVTWVVKTDSDEIFTVRAFHFKAGKATQSFQLIKNR